MVITTPMIVYRHGDDVPGERIREILVYEDCISQPDWKVENPDNSDLPTTQSARAAQIELTRWPERRGSTEDCPTDSDISCSVFRVCPSAAGRRERTALVEID
jgi:hypothetical protein